jgi:DNA polymerase III sliding clamp (beta) subunit (PCNA family)
MQNKPIGRKALLTKLQTVRYGLSAREVDQSSCFVFERGQVMTYNDEVACRTPSELPSDFKAAVLAAPLLAVLTKMPDENVLLSVDDGQLIVSGHRRRAGIRMETEITLPISVVEEPRGWQPLPEDFDEALKMVLSCCSTDENKRFAMSCVHFTPEWIEGCDNDQMIRWRTPTGATEFLIRSRSIEFISSLGMIQICETPAWAHFRNSSGLLVSVRRYAEDYPDLDQVLDRAAGHEAVLPGGLTEAVKAAEVFSAEGSFNKLRIELMPHPNPEKSQVKVRGESAAGWYAEVITLTYNGPKMAFAIPPHLLLDVVEHGKTCQIGETQMIVATPKYTFVTSLTDKESGAA